MEVKAMPLSCSVRSLTVVGGERKRERERKGGRWLEGVGRVERLKSEVQIE